MGRVRKVVGVCHTIFFTFVLDKQCSSLVSILPNMDVCTDFELNSSKTIRVMSNTCTMPRNNIDEHRKIKPNIDICQKMILDEII